MASLERLQKFSEEFLGRKPVNSLVFLHSSPWNLNVKLSVWKNSLKKIQELLQIVVKRSF